MTISLWSRVLGLGTVGAAWVMASSHATATQDRVNTAESQLGNASYMDEFIYNQANFSGDPVMDEAASNWTHWAIALRDFTHGLHIKGEHLMRDVIGDNLPWIALGAAGLAIGGRDLVKGTLKAAHQMFGKPIGVLWRGLVHSLNRPGILGVVGRGLQKALVGTARLTIRNLPATLLAGLGVAVFASKFGRTVSGEASRQYFQDEMIEGDKGNSATFSFKPYGDLQQG